MEEDVCERHVHLQVLQLLQRGHERILQSLPSRTSPVDQLCDGQRHFGFLLGVLEADLQEPLDALLHVFWTGLGLVPISLEVVSVLLVGKVLEELLHICLVESRLLHTLRGLCPDGLRLGELVDVRWPHSDLGRCKHRAVLASGGLPLLLDGILPDVFLGLRLLLEELLHPLGASEIEQILDQELDALREGRLAVGARVPPQVDEPSGELVHQQLPVRGGVQSEADGLQQLADALDHMLLR
mmetsp:Transcript_35790/g.64640  ORF Transcript_35790/g.64640 Transcript_35790/m.64640 type:complete len:241 (+) Transcript_35790:595-1317(+)